MRLATVRTGGTLRCVRVDEDQAVETGYGDVGELLAVDGWRELGERAAGPSHSIEGLHYAPVIPRPGKIVCLGLNYASHIREMGRELPEYPTIFAKYPEALIGAYDDVVLPAASSSMDWEAELAVIVGARVRHADDERAAAAIAGYAIINDVTARDWQYRTLQWLQGKTFEATTPFGPFLVTTPMVDHQSDEGATNTETGSRPAAGVELDLSCCVGDDVVQSANTRDLVFGPVAAIKYVSTIMTLQPGDVLALGTPGGVGHGQKPPRYLRTGDVLTTTIAGLGSCRNVCVAESRIA